MATKQTAFKVARDWVRYATILLTSFPLSSLLTLGTRLRSSKNLTLTQIAICLGGIGSWINKCQNIAKITKKQ